MSTDEAAVDGYALFTGQLVHTVCLVALLNVLASHERHDEFRVGLYCPGEHGRQVPSVVWKDIWKPALHVQLAIEKDADGEDASAVQATQAVAAEDDDAYLPVAQAWHVRSVHPKSSKLICNIQSSPASPNATRPAGHGVQACPVDGEPWCPLIHLQLAMVSDAAGATEPDGHC